MRTVRVTATAEEDLQEIWEYVAQYNTEAASKIIKEISGKFAFITDISHTVCHHCRRLSAGPIRRCTSRAASSRFSRACVASVGVFATACAWAEGVSGAGDINASMSVAWLLRSLVCNCTGAQSVHCGIRRKCPPGSLRRVNTSPSATRRPQLAQRSGRNARYTASLEPSARWV